MKTDGSMDPDAKTWLNDLGTMYSLNDVLAGKVDPWRGDDRPEILYEIKMYDLGGGNSIAVMFKDGKVWAQSGDMPDEALIGLIFKGPLHKDLKPILR